MAFQIIKAETRTQRMIDWFAGICQSVTDFVVGSKIRTKFESVAVEMEAQDFAFYQAVKKAIPVSIYNAFNFTILPAVKASGVVTFGATTAPSSDVFIPKGTRVNMPASGTVAAKEYEVQTDTTLASGQTTVQTAVISTTAGQAGNTQAATITTISSTIAGIDTVTNAAAFTNGTDRETEDFRRARFQAYILTLSRGTNAAVESGAKTAQLLDGSGNITEQVTTASIVEPYIADPTLPAANITCYIYNGTGSTSSDLVTKTQSVIDGYTKSDGTKVAGYKAAGVVCTVAAATEVPTNVTVAVTAVSSATTADKTQLQTDIGAAITVFIRAMAMEQPLFRSKIIDIIMGMANAHNVTVSAPSSDATPAAGHIITPGTISVTVS
jgi:uncharacterized phage protein gp47/JayE